VPLERTAVSKESFAYIIRVERISELGTTLTATALVLLQSKLQLLITADDPTILMMEAIRSSETSILTRARLLHMQEGDILQL
jgi:hypothetical protein